MVRPVHRPRPAQIWHALAAPKQGDAHLSAYRQPTTVQLLLGHTKESTVRYLGIEIDDAIKIAEKIEV
jgi:hypothetical protein